MTQLVDSFQRHITYVRVSVTDRCDFRCQYCMAEKMTFLPKNELLNFDELLRICHNFIELGVKKIRVTGGEPLVRRDIGDFLEKLSLNISESGLQEICLTTNASRLAIYAARLAKAGLRRVNISLDTLDADKFAAITRFGKLKNVLEGINAALEAGLKIKINTVVLRDFNEDEIIEIMEWAHAKNIDMTLIEVMPMGDTGIDRLEQYVPLLSVREKLEKQFTLEPLSLRTGGPARYVKVQQTGGILGFIAPLSNNFCDGCNRIRLTCTGQIYMCLGQPDKVDLRQIIRSGASDAQLKKAIVNAINKKPFGHDFAITKKRQAPAVKRFMSVTGG